MDKPLTVKEVAQFLSVTEKQVRDYARRGILKGYKIGNGVKPHWRFLKQDVIDFLSPQQERIR